MIRVTTQNIDFTLNDAAWKRIVDDLKKSSDVILFQEAKWTNLHKYADDEWAVFQQLDNDSTAGTGIMWRKSLGKKINSGLYDFVPSKRGIAMPTRHIAWVDIRLNSNGKAVRFASAHYPPQRFKIRWGVADDAIRNFVRKTRREGRAFVLGSDFNATVGNDVHSLRRRIEVRVRGIRIDGFIVARRLGASKAKNLGNNRSDHDPIQIKVWFKNRKRV